MKIFRFGVFELDPAARELRKRGLRLRLQDQPFRVLDALLERAGEIVTREELQQQLWPEDTFVDFNHGLNSAVNRIRQALGDAASNPRFIETIPKLGYRFIAPLQTDELVDQSTPPPPPTVDRAAPPGISTPAPSSRPQSEWAIAIHIARIVAIVVPAAIFAAFLATSGIETFRALVTPSRSPAPTPAPGPWAVRLLSGSDTPASDSQGRLWSADSYYAGGSATGRDRAVFSADSSSSGTAEPILFAGERYGDFRYSIPAPPGDYVVRLYFAETWFGSGNPGGGGELDRLFRVLLNGEVWLDRFDIYEQAGGANRAVMVERRITLPPDRGQIVLDFISQVQNAEVNAIEITPAGDD